MLGTKADAHRHTPDVAAAIVAHLLLADGVIETFWIGGPMRWWIGSILCLYVLVSVLAWRHMSWRGRALGAVAILMTMVGIGVWLPGGVTDGVRVLGFQPSSVRSLTAVAGLTLAGWVMLRTASLARPARWVGAALAAVGAAAVAGWSPLDVASIPLPWLLQSAIVAGVAVLSLALVSVLSGTVRQPVEGSPGRIAFEAVALTTTLALLVHLLPLPGGGARALARTPPGAPAGGGPVDASPGGSQTMEGRVALIENGLQALEDGIRDAPRDRWDPDDVVSAVGREPDRLFAWVRANTVWIPYRGMLRGAVGVLMDRQGNSLDRAILLATLLKQAGHTVRLARGELSRHQVLRLLPDLVAQQALRPTVPVDLEPMPEADITSVAAQYHMDAAGVTQAIQRQEDHLAPLLTDLQRRVDDHAGRLLSAVARPDAETEWLGRYQAALDALRDHWWVQREERGQWLDMDVLAVESAASSGIRPQSTTTVKEIPSDLRNEIAVRVGLEYWANGSLTRTHAMEHVLRPSELIGERVVLQFWPGSWPVEVHPDPQSNFGLRGAALQQQEWTAALVVGREAVAQGVIRATIQPPGAAAGNPFGGLGGAMGRGSSSSSRAGGGSQLIAVWIEYEARAPGASPRLIRRAAFDLLGPAARAVSPVPRPSMTEAQRLTRSLSLMMQTEILALACDPAPEFVAHLAARSLVGNRSLLRAIARDEFALEQPSTDLLFTNAAAPLTPLYALALARRQWNPMRDQLYTGRPSVLTRHRYPAFTGDQLVLRDAIDIVSNESDVTLVVTDAFPVRLVQGVLDTNLEALLHPPSRDLGNTADAFDRAQSWVTVTPAQRDGMRDLDLPPDAEHAIVEDLERGYSIIAPRRPVPGASGEYIGWWRLDSTTGDTLGVAANGWGQSMSERGVQYNAFVQMAKTFAFEYAFCQAVPQVANQAVAFLQPYRDQLPPWLPPLAQVQDPRALYAANKKGCLIGAMIGTAVTATLPLLLITLRPVWARLAARLGPFMRDQRGGIRIPPGLVRGPVRGGPPVPNSGGPSRGPNRGINPFGRTQPDPSKTQLDPGAAPPPPAPRPGPPVPTTREAARENLKQAAANYEAAHQANLKATSEYLQYNQRHPNSRFRDWADNPGQWDKDLAEALRNEARAKSQAEAEAAEALHQAQAAARDAEGAARGAQGKGGFPPPRPPANPLGCPPNCGNNNPTGPSGQADVSAVKTSIGLGALSGGS